MRPRAVALRAERKRSRTGRTAWKTSWMSRCGSGTKTSPTRKTRLLDVDADHARRCARRASRSSSSGCPRSFLPGGWPRCWSSPDLRSFARGSRPRSGATESKEVDARAVSVHRTDENDLLVAYEELSARLLELNPVRRVTTLSF